MILAKPIALTILLFLAWQLGKNSGYWTGYQDGYHEVDKHVLPPEE